MAARLFSIFSILWGVVIVVVTATPADSIPAAFDSADKLIHLGVFAVFSFLIAGSTFFNKLFPQIVFAFSFGIATELVQYLVPGRSPDIYDLVFNSLGILIGAVIYSPIANKLRN